MTEDDRPATRRTARLLALLAVLFLAAVWLLHSISSGRFTVPVIDEAWLSLALAGICILLGVSIVRVIAILVTQTTASYLGAARVRTARTVITTLLYIVLAIAIASQTQLDLSGIALSGAVTGVVVGIAAQTSLSNIIAGVVILFARPYRPGQFVTVRAAAFAGSEYSGVVADITLFYTTIFAGRQEIRVPNSAMVSSVVVLRPQALDVYIPLILPPARWEHLSTADLASQLAGALPAGRLVTATVERMDGASVQVGLHASVASEEERALLERALLRALAPVEESQPTGPHLDGA